MENEQLSTEKIYEERISAMEDMLERTTSYMESIQSELEASKTEIEEKNNDLKDSIRYASVIQEAILPSSTTVNRHFEEFFIYHKQKEGVGGDFPFLFEKNNKIFVAAVDCTGHGVPGSLISMSASFILQQVILNNQNLCAAGDILTKFNTAFFDYFHFYKNKQYNTVKIGMDMALLVYNKVEQCISFSGARRPIYFFDNSLKIIKTDKMSIGESKDYQFENFENIFPDTGMYYMFSDGITDQYGKVSDLKPYGKKLKSTRVKSFIKEINNKSSAEQKQLLTQFMNNWQGEIAQTDDQLFIGLKI